MKWGLWRGITEYIDGLGRPIQVVVKNGSWVTDGTAKDLVSVKVYDEYGRETYSYLPFQATNSDGSFKTDPFLQQKTSTIHTCMDSQGKQVWAQTDSTGHMAKQFTNRLR
ncbi:MAG: DUF6443 domain-containing protein [Chitinophagaceae bacterium]